MRVGYFTTAAGGLRVTELARELELRGFDSMWLPEHSHIPVQRVPAPPFGEHLPQAYFSLISPLVALGAAAAVTTELIVATGVSMALEHDVLDLAAAVASLDVVSEGRAHFGVGAGWLREELANHRPDVPFEQRYSALVERIAALRCCWEQASCSFDGRWDSFRAAIVEPKPVQPRLPVGMGCSGTLGMRLAAEHADEWLPIDGALQMHGGVGLAVEHFRDLVEASGRPRDSVPISLFVWGFEPGSPSMDQLEPYRELGLQRLVLGPNTLLPHGRDATWRRLDEFQPFVDHRLDEDVAQSR